MDCAKAWLAQRSCQDIEPGTSDYRNAEHLVDMLTSSRILAGETRRWFSRHCRDHRGEAMITNDQELEATQERIRRFQAQVVHLRKVETNPLAYRLSASGFLAEIDRMQLEVRDYLALHPSEFATSA
jgi:hypothetical protein